MAVFASSPETFLVEEIPAYRPAGEGPHTYLWIETYALDALCSVAVEHQVDASARWIDQLEAITARRGVRELLLRATVYRARLGEPGASDAARSLAAEIDNPALDDLLASGELSPAL